MRQALLLSSFHRWVDWGAGKSALLCIAQIVIVRVGKSGSGGCQLNARLSSFPVDVF